jgi:hypothetical protein
MQQTESLLWTNEAKKKVGEIPVGPMRDLTMRRVEEFAKKRGYSTITPDVVQEKYDDWAKKSRQTERSLDWNEGALERIMNIPEFVRNSVIREIERCAFAKGEDVVTFETLDEVKEKWGITTRFHTK